MADDPLAFVPRLAKKARLRFDRHSGQYMIVYPERGLALNASAAAIAKQCDGTHTVAEIARIVAREAGEDDAERVAGDVTLFIAELARKGLLEP